MDKLEFEPVRQILAEFASCALGRGMAMKVKPTSRADLIVQWQAQVAEMIEAASDLDLPPFGGIHDIREAIRVAVPPHCLEPNDLAVIAETLDATHGIVDWAARLRPSANQLRTICQRVGDFKPLANTIREVIGSNGEVRDDASARLRRIRTEISEARINVGHVFDRLLRDRNLTRLLRYPQATFHEDRLVLPLAAEHRGRIPGIVHRSSDSGATLFVEPAAAVELNNRIISLKADESTEVGRLLSHLTHQLFLNREQILATMDTLAVLDLITAKVRFARVYRLNSPEVSADHKLLLRQARHPLLVRMMGLAKPKGSVPVSGFGETGTDPLRQRAASRHDDVVPIDVRLGDDFDLLVVTGPNTGGKTVALKTVGLIALMAQAGLPIPAAPGSTVPVYKEILIDIGDEQSLQQSLSTFSAHLSRMLMILKQASPGTLVLIDELGAGTDPDEGAAIGQAIVEELLRRHCSAMVTTHLGVLKSVAYREVRAENASVEFDIKTLQPTYRLLIGEPGSSNAINIASRLGLPPKVIEAARKHLSESNQQLDRAIRGTLQSRRQAEQARADAETAKAKAMQETDAARRELESLQVKQAEFDRWVERIAALRPGDKVHVRRFDKSGTIVRVLLHKQLAVVAVGAMEMEIPLREITEDKACRERTKAELLILLHPPLSSVFTSTRTSTGLGPASLGRLRVNTPLAMAASTPSVRMDPGRVTTRQKRPKRRSPCTMRGYSPTPGSVASAGRDLSPASVTLLEPAVTSRLAADTPGSSAVSTYRSASSCTLMVGANSCSKGMAAAPIRLSRSTRLLTSFWMFERENSSAGLKGDRVILVSPAAGRGEWCLRSFYTAGAAAVLASTILLELFGNGVCRHAIPPAHT